MERMTDSELSTRITQFMERKSINYPELLSKYAKLRGAQDATAYPAHGGGQTSRMGFVH